MARLPTLVAGLRRDECPAGVSSLFFAPLFLPCAPGPTAVDLAFEESEDDDEGEPSGKCIEVNCAAGGGL